MARYRTYKHPVTRRGVRRRNRRNMGELGLSLDVAQKGLTASMDAVKSVGMVALLAAGGAVATDYIFTNLLSKKDSAGKAMTEDIMGFKNGSWEQNVAKAVVGIAGGLVIGKFAKKPKLGAAFAIGAVALAFYNIVQKEILKPVAGMGYISARNARGFQPAALGASRVTDTRAFQPMPVPAAGFGSF